MQAWCGFDFLWAAVQFIQLSPPCGNINAPNNYQVGHADRDVTMHSYGRGGQAFGRRIEHRRCSGKTIELYFEATSS